MKLETCSRVRGDINDDGSVWPLIKRASQMKSSTKVALQMVASLVLLYACATHVTETDKSGFLSDYSKLERIDDDTLRYVSGTLGNYSRFIIDPVVIAFRQAPDKQVFTDEELSEISAYYSMAVREALIGDGGYPVVEDPAPGVARIRIGITDVEETIGYLNIAVFTKVTGLGLGGASFDGEVVDSVSGKQLGAVISWGTGSRYLKAGISHMGDAKIAIDRWAKDLRSNIDTAHHR